MIGIYALIAEEELKKALELIHSCMNISVHLLDTEGRFLLHYGEEPAYCACLKDSVFPAAACTDVHLKASRYSSNLGEAYIYVCCGELSYITYPLLFRKELLGSVIAGPFSIGEPDSTLLLELQERYSLTAEQQKSLNRTLGGIVSLSPKQVSTLKELLEGLLSPLLPAERARLMQEKEKMFQQARLNEAIQLYKQLDVIPEDTACYEKEQHLLSCVRTGNVPEAQQILTEILALLHIDTGGNPAFLKYYAAELSGLLSRAALEVGALPGDVSAIRRQFYALLDQDTASVVYALQNMMESCMNAIVSYQTDPQLRQALLYIAEHYNSHLTLSGLAEMLGISRGHLSILFRGCMGCSFSEYLNRIRVEESKRLLLYSDYSLSNIAVAVGFADQSCYCKAFHRIVGISPGKYRQG